MNFFKKEEFKYDLNISPLMSFEESNIILDYIKTRKISDSDIDVLVKWKTKRENVANKKTKELNKKNKNNIKNICVFVDDPNQPCCFISSILKTKPTNENIESIKNHFSNVINELEKKFTIIGAIVKFDENYPTLYCLIFHLNRRDQKPGFIDNNGNEFEIAMESINFYWVYENVLSKI